MSGPKAVDTGSVAWQGGPLPSETKTSEAWQGKQVSPESGTQSNGKIDGIVEDRLASPQKPGSLDKAGNLKMTPGNKQDPLSNIIKDVAEKQLNILQKAKIGDRGLRNKMSSEAKGLNPKAADRRLRERASSPQRNEKTNELKSIQSHFSIKGHPEFSDNVARVALKVLQGKHNEADVALLSDHNIIVRTRDSNKYPELQKISLVFKNQHIAEGSFGKIYKSYNLKQGATVTKLGHGNVEENNVEMAVDQNIIERITSKAMNDKDLKALLSKSFVFGKFNRGNQELGQEMPFAQSDLYHAFPKSSNKEKVEFLKQILDAGKVLHDLGFIHRDIKPQNILLVDGVAKLSDFGLTISEDDIRWEALAGTPTYLAPELKDNSQQSTKQDCYAFGLIALENVLGDTFPFDDDRLDKIEEMRLQIKELDEKTPHPIYKVIVGLLEENPEKRMSLAAATELLGSIKPEEVNNLHKLSLKYQKDFKERVAEIGQTNGKDAEAILNRPGNENEYLIRYDNKEKQFFIDHLEPSSSKFISTALSADQEKVLLEDGLIELQDILDTPLLTVIEFNKLKEEEITKQRIQEIGIMKSGLALSIIGKKDKKENDQLLFYNEIKKEFCIANKVEKGIKVISPEQHSILLEKGLEGLREHMKSKGLNIVTPNKV